jgi:hypothetical protein
MDTADTDATVTLYRPTGEKELARTDSTRRPID